MSYVITQSCCSDASCLSACPVNCIRPTPDDPDFDSAEMLYIDPDTCIDCGACADACPVDAILPASKVTDAERTYIELNAEYYRQHPLTPSWLPHREPVLMAPDSGSLRVAIVGSGAAAWYAAQELLAHPNVEVEMFERLPTPWGLIRAGVAPDHQDTKKITDQFRWTKDRQQRFHLHLNVEIGSHIRHDELLAHHTAVIYAHGAAADRPLEIPGEELPGSLAATAFVNWYNGHPDFADLAPDLSGTRAIVIGNGNVALDVARMLVIDPELLARTDIADHALAALRASSIEEVVVCGRRGPVQSSFTTSELLALTVLPGVDVVVDERDMELDSISGSIIDDPNVDPTLRFKLELLQRLSRTAPTPGNKRILLSFLTSPIEIEGDRAVTGLKTVRNELQSDVAGRLQASPVGVHDTIDASLVLRSVGYRGTPLPGVPFDDTLGRIPNRDGRVLGADGQPLRGVYSAGWIKRGATGGLGSNRRCAQQTVTAVIEDFTNGRLLSTKIGHRDTQRLLQRRRPEAIDETGWHAIDIAEIAKGRAAGKPRTKLTTTGELLTAAHRPRKRR